MRYTYDPRRILPIVLMLTLLAGVAACSHTPQSAIDAMDRAENLMEEHPDSALAIMQTIDSSLLHGRADKARYALMLSMALDKNYIDTTDFSILQPAIDYYEKHGTPDQRLRTRYYEGRIWMNRGEDGKALTAFLRAAEDSAGCKDSLGLALLYTAQGHLHWKEYQYDRYTYCNSKAAEIYKSVNDTSRYMESLIRVLNGAGLSDDTLLASSVMPECIEGVIRYAGKGEFLPMVISAFPYLRSQQEFQDFIGNIKTDSILKPASIYIANAFYQYDDPVKAKEYLDLSFPTDSIFYFITRISILERLDDLTGTVDAYEDYLKVRENEINTRMRSNLLFARKQYALEKESMQKIAYKEKFTQIASATAIILFLICVIILQRLRNARLKSRLAETEKRELQLRLKDIQDEIADEKDRLDNILSENHGLSERLKFLITQRVEMLNGIIAKEICKCEKYAVAYDNMILNIDNDKEAFMRDIHETYSVTHPRFMEYLVAHGLTEYEQQFVCLYALGLRGKDVSNFLGKSSHKNEVLEVRRKFGLNSGSPNLKDHVRFLMDTL